MYGTYNPYAYSRRRTCRAPACVCESPCEAYERGYQHVECRGPEDDCPGCDECIEVVEDSKTVVARAPRSEAGRKRRAASGIEPGDRIRVTRGFEYQKGGGPRLGYYYREYLVEKKQPMQEA